MLDKGRVIDTCQKLKILIRDDGVKMIDPIHDEEEF